MSCYQVVKRWFGRPYRRICARNSHSGGAALCRSAPQCGIGRTGGSGYFRGLDLRLDHHPNVAALLDRLDARDSFRRNPIPWWEPGVIGYEGDGVTPIYERADPMS